MVASNKSEVPRNQRYTSNWFVRAPYRTAIDELDAVTAVTSCRDVVDDSQRAASLLKLARPRGFVNDDATDRHLCFYVYVFQGLLLSRLLFLDDACECARYVPCTGPF